MTTNAGQIDLQPLEILFFKFFHILQRPLVLGQLSLFLLCLLIAWGGNYYFWLRLGKKVSHYQKLIFSNYHQSAFAKYCRFIYFFLTPTLAVILVSITNFIYFKFIPHNGLIESGLLLTILFFSIAYFCIF